MSLIQSSLRRIVRTAGFHRLRPDVTYAPRGRRRSPAFTATVVSTFALGIGANAATFSLLDRLFLRPPPGVVRPRELRCLYAILPGALLNGSTLVLEDPGSWRSDNPVHASDTL